MCKSSSEIPKVNHLWLVLMNVLVLQSFLVVSIRFQNCIYCLCNFYCICKLPSSISAVCCLRHGQENNCDSMGHQGSLLLSECLLTPTVLSICIICVLPVLGVNNKDCTSAEALSSSQWGYYRVISSCSTHKMEELAWTALRHLPALQSSTSLIHHRPSARTNTHE